MVFVFFLFYWIKEFRISICLPFSSSDIPEIKLTFGDVWR